MERIGVRELRQHASRYLERVKSGESVEVTERGKLIALLVPPEPARAARERLIADGQLIPAASEFALPVRARTQLSTQVALDEIREDR